MLPTHRVDVPTLERYLERHVESFKGPLTVRQFVGGQSNPTYYLRAGSGEYVLRRKPPGKLLPSAHAVEREYRVMTALAGSGVPVPRTYALCEDADVAGTPFYVMAVRGRSRLQGSAPARRAARRTSGNLRLAGRCPGAPAHGGLASGRARGLRPAGNYFASQLHRWTSQYRASETESIAAMEELIVWLPAHIPAGDETTLVHGDFRLGNMLIHSSEPRIAAVLDWELSTLGHPLADLGYNCLPFRLRHEQFEGFAGQARPAGIPSEEAYLEAYWRRTGGASIPHWEFYIAFAMFRLAAIAQGIMGRVVAGTANDPNARDRGRRARPLAEAAWALVQRAFGA